MKIKTLESYRRELFGAALALWRGIIDVSQFFELVSSAVENEFILAWRLGLSVCNVSPNNVTPTEQLVFDEVLSASLSRVGSLGEWIDTNNRESGFAWRQIKPRLRIWLNRFEQVIMLGQAIGCADRRYVWRLGKAEHCSTCLKLDGKVRPMSWWHLNVMPRQITPRVLECGGYLCQCRLELTDEPLSRGRMPALP